MAASVEIVPIE